MGSTGFARRGTNQAGGRPRAMDGEGEGAVPGGSCDAWSSGGGAAGAAAAAVCGGPSSGGDGAGVRSDAGQCGWEFVGTGRDCDVGEPVGRFRSAGLSGRRLCRPFGRRRIPSGALAGVHFIRHKARLDSGALSNQGRNPILGKERQGWAPGLDRYFCISMGTAPTATVVCPTVKFFQVEFVSVRYCVYPLGIG